MGKGGRKLGPPEAPIGVAKSCGACGELKDLSQFYARRRSKDGRDWHCKPCSRKSAIEWAKSNPERVNSRNKKFRDKDLERARQYQRDYHYRYPELHAQRVREWRRKNPDRTLERGRARRSKTPPLSAELVKARFEVFGNRCAYCGHDQNLTVDHVIPISRGGKHVLANIRPACKPCNSSKNAKPLNEWLASRLANALAA